MNRETKMAGGIFFGWTLLLLFGPPVLLEIIMEPACGPMESSNSFSSDLRVAVIADLHLAGPGTAWVDRIRRESFMQSVLKVLYPSCSPFASDSSSLRLTRGRHVSLL